jgi:hypothetical protein
MGSEYRNEYLATVFVCNHGKATEDKRRKIEATIQSLSFENQAWPMQLGPFKLEMVRDHVGNRKIGQRAVETERGYIITEVPLEEEGMAEQAIALIEGQAPEDIAEMQGLLVIPAYSDTFAGMSFPDRLVIVWTSRRRDIVSVGEDIVRPYESKYLPGTEGFRALTEYYRVTAGRGGRGGRGRGWGAWGRGAGARGPGRPTTSGSSRILFGDEKSERNERALVQRSGDLTTSATILRVLSEDPEMSRQIGMQLMQQNEEEFEGIFRGMIGSVVEEKVEEVARGVIDQVKSIRAEVGETKREAAEVRETVKEELRVVREMQVEVAEAGEARSTRLEDLMGQMMVQATQQQQTQAAIAQQQAQLQAQQQASINQLVQLMASSATTAAATGSPVPPPAPKRKSSEMSEEKEVVRKSQLRLVDGFLAKGTERQGMLFLTALSLVWNSRK